MNYTGYNAVRDKGLEIVLKANNSSKVTASFYNPWDLPGSVGGSDYRDNIATCNSAKVDIGGPILLRMATWSAQQHKAPAGSNRSESKRVLGHLL